jgi:hypothetical protein
MELTNACACVCVYLLSGARWWVLGGTRKRCTWARGRVAPELVCDERTRLVPLFVHVSEEKWEP